MHRSQQLSWLSQTAAVAAGFGLTEDMQALGSLHMDNPLMDALNHDASSFLTLTTCSWEQDVSCLKVYIPLRGVHNDMIRTHFTRHSVEVRCACCACCALRGRLGATCHRGNGQAIKCQDSRTGACILQHSGNMDGRRITQHHASLWSE